MRQATCETCGHYQDEKCLKLLPECAVPVKEGQVACCFHEPVCERCGARATVVECEVTPVVGYLPCRGPRRSISGVLPDQGRAYCATCAAAKKDAKEDLP
jgi:hypothetical protein